MPRPILVLRPEPGNAATCARVRAIGLTPLPCPLFAVRAVAWQSPDDAGFDALLLTSAQAPRLAGTIPTGLRDLPVIAVGEATAAAARAVGLSPALVGTTDAAAVIADARARGWRRLLHLTGRDRMVDARGVAPIIVYESVAQAPDPTIDWHGTVALLHSPRAARRFASIADQETKESIRVVAFSAAIAAAAGGGWLGVDALIQPDDDALVALAASRAIDP